MEARNYPGRYYEGNPGKKPFLRFISIKKVKAVNPSPQYGRKYHPPLTSSTKATLLF
jgi:hypothetical protein